MTAPRSIPKTVVNKPPARPSVCSRCGGWPALKLDGLRRKFCEECWKERDHE